MAKIHLPDTPKDSGKLQSIISAVVFHLIRMMALAETAAGVSGFLGGRLYRTSLKLAAQYNCRHGTRRALFCLHPFQSVFSDDQVIQVTIRFTVYCREFWEIS